VLDSTGTDGYLPLGAWPKYSRAMPKRLKVGAIGAVPMSLAYALGMNFLRSLLTRVNAWFDKERLKTEMENHCDHSPIGSCGAAECNAEVEAGHFSY
jgi:hypothetical protein